MCCTVSCAAGARARGDLRQQSEVREEELARGAGRATEKGREGPWVLNRQIRWLLMAGEDPGVPRRSP